MARACGVSVRLLNTLSATCRERSGSACGGEGRACGGEGRACGGEGRACGGEGPNVGGEGGQSLTSKRAGRWVGGLGHLAAAIDAEWQGKTRIDHQWAALTPIGRGRGSCWGGNHHVGRFKPTPQARWI